MDKASRLPFLFTHFRIFSQLFLIYLSHMFFSLFTSLWVLSYNLPISLISMPLTLKATVSHVPPISLPVWLSKTYERCKLNSHHFSSAKAMQKHDIKSHYRNRLTHMQKQKQENVSDKTKPGKHDIGQA